MIERKHTLEQLPKIDYLLAHGSSARWGRVGDPPAWAVVRCCGRGVRAPKGGLDCSTASAEPHSVGTESPRTGRPNLGRARASSSSLRPMRPFACRGIV